MFIYLTIVLVLFAVHSFYCAYIIGINVKINFYAFGIMIAL